MTMRRRRISGRIDTGQRRVIRAREPVTRLDATTAQPIDRGRRARLAGSVRRHVPISRWLPAYRRADLGPDLTAGLTTWGVMVPVALAYASLAGLPPEYGLITAFAALAAYAVFGTSRHLRVTVSSTMAVMSLALVAPIADGDPSRFIALSGALALIVGALLIIAGAARLGFISEFLAKPVVTGFIIGVAVMVIVRQLPKLLGIPGSSGSVVDQLRSIVAQLPETDPLTLAIGAGCAAAHPAAAPPEPTPPRGAGSHGAGHPGRLRLRPGG